MPDKPFNRKPLEQQSRVKLRKWNPKVELSNDLAFSLQLAWEALDSGELYPRDEFAELHDQVASLLDERLDQSRVSNLLLEGVDPKAYAKLSPHLAAQLLLENLHSRLVASDPTYSSSDRTT